jgi:hypothetical protein
LHRLNEGVRRRSWLQDTQAPHLPRWLLRARRKRPCRCTSNTGDELSPPCMSRKQHSEG